MNIAVIGTGNVGGALGTGWARAGHQVIFGSREPQSSDTLDLLKKAGTSACAATNREAAERSDVVTLAVPWKAARQVLSELGDLNGKVLIDVTNPFSPDLKSLEVGLTTSAGEQIAQWAVGARVVKAFNTVGFNVMENPRFGKDAAVMFYCGEDSAAKATVRRLIEQLGFDAQDAGPITRARILEPFSWLWVTLAVHQGYGRDFAFKLLKR